MRQMTVGLPLWKSKHRGWLALEGLIRQKDIPCEWELIVCEELEECIGWNGLIPYKKQINDLGGVVKYVPIPTWIPLSAKWRVIAHLADPDSKYLLLHAGDCFSQPYRLSDTYKIFEESGADWVQSPWGYFYHIEADQVYLYDRYYDGRDKPPFGHTGLNMAIKTAHMKLLPEKDIPYNVDGWMFRYLLWKLGSVIQHENKTDHWKLGFDSHGLNHISGYRGDMLALEKKPFRKVINIGITDIVDKAIADRMKDSFDFIKRRGGHKFLHPRTTA